VTAGGPSSEPATRRDAGPGLRPIAIAVVDYGAGNLVSIEQAFAAVGGQVRLVHDADELGEPDLLVVPGVGAAAPAMERLEAAGLVGPIRSWIAADRPFLGICLGLQLLFEQSDEDGAVTLGVFPGRTVRLADAPTLPHIGWNQVELRRKHPAFDRLPDGTDMYFVHSYVGAPAGPDGEAAILGETTHGSRFASAVARDNLLGVQFHPERSGRSGLRLLANVVAWAAPRAAPGSRAGTVARIG
jgi:glutamine amidotransferase